jgi:peptidoglycan/LPS O-acetylase OafA/YrhL
MAKRTGAHRGVAAIDPPELANPPVSATTTAVPDTGDEQYQPTTVAPPADNPRFPMVESVRAIASFSVVFYHVGTIGGVGSLGGLGQYADQLNIGVALFFVISGFLLYRPFVSARLKGTHEIRVGPYLVRRAKRILPAYWVALTVLTIAFHLPGVFSSDWWRYYGLVQIYDMRTFGNGMGVAWTLCIEASFYLSLPLVDRGVRLLGRALPGRRGGFSDLVTIGLLAAASIAFTVFIYEAGIDPRWTQNLLGTFDWFACGMAIAIYTLTRPRISARAAVLSWIGALAVFVAMRAVPWADSSAPLAGVAGHVEFAILAALLFLPAVSVGGGFIGRLLGLRVLRWLGLISYSIYLYHATLIPPLLNHHGASILPGNAWLSLAVCTAAVVIPTATLSYYLIEAPSVRFKFERRNSARPASARTT